MRAKIMFILIVFANLGNPVFATLGPVEEDFFHLKEKIKNSSDIIVGDVEIIYCREKEALKTMEDLYGTFGTRKYMAKVLPFISLKGDIVVKKKKMKFINIYFENNISPFSFQDSIYKPTIKTGFLYTTGLYLFFLKHIKNNDYKIIGYKFSALPFFPIKNLKEGMLKTPWDAIMMSLSNKKAPLRIHKILYQFLMKSDISTEKKKKVKQTHKIYLSKKIIEMKNALKRVDSDPESSPKTESAEEILKNAE